MTTERRVPILYNCRSPNNNDSIEDNNDIIDENESERKPSYVGLSCAVSGYRLVKKKLSLKAFQTQSLLFVFFSFAVVSSVTPVLHGKIVPHNNSKFPNPKYWILTTTTI